MRAVHTQLSMQGRRRIEDWWHSKALVVEMARVFKRHKSTIFHVVNQPAASGHVMAQFGPALNVEVFCTNSF